MKRLAALILLLAGTGVSANDLPFNITPIATFNEPWAMTFLPDGRMLVTEMRGRLYVVTPDGAVANRRGVENVPDVAYRGQGGLGDVILHPDFEDNRLVYLSYAESGIGDTRGAAVARGRLEFDDRGRGLLRDVEVIWRQNPKVTDDGHYGHRMVFDDNGYLFISSGDRQKFEPAQHMTGNLGKIVRLHDDGRVPDDNPFADRGDVTAEIWSLGHRNPLGLAFDSRGRLWNTEMGPLHGDEFNLVVRSANYGYPIVSQGDHYNGDPIPDHDTRPEFEAPKVYWVPTIAPANVIFYDGDLFPELRGSALIAGLASQAIIRVEVDGDEAREVEQGPDGALYVLEDRDGGRLLKLTPR